MAQNFPRSPRFVAIQYWRRRHGQVGLSQHTNHTQEGGPRVLVWGRLDFFLPAPPRGPLTPFFAGPRR